MQWDTLKLPPVFNLRPTISTISFRPRTEKRTASPMPIANSKSTNRSKQRRETAPRKQ